MPAISSAQLLAEIEDILRTMPSLETIRDERPENLAWFGRASAVVTLWSLPRSVSFDSFVRAIQSSRATDPGPPIRGLLTLLHEARHALRLMAVGPLTVAVDSGGVFDYFDEIRRVVESARLDIYFVDPYLDAEFVSRYLPHVAQGVSVRLLAREKLSSLTPAVDLFRQQSNASIEIRSIGGFHDRYIFVDRSACYQSGASFKDGAKKAPTTFTQIVDAFSAMSHTYEQLWTSAKSNCEAM